jgi:predicted ATP-dependent endonuclease of OLD family
VKIAKLQIRNFRSIEDIEFDVPQVCALVGPNNGGKTNILEAIRRVLGTSFVSASSFDMDDVYMRDQERDIAITCTASPPLKYVPFKYVTATEIHALSFEYKRYKVGEQKGERRIEQKCLDASGKQPQVLARAPKKGEQHQYKPLVNIPTELREQIPLIHVGANRSLSEQLPSARQSMLRRLFEDVSAGFEEATNTVQVKARDGTISTIPRAARFERLISLAMELLRTDKFNEIEQSIKLNALRQLGFDPVRDADRLDLFFTPMEPFDFYKSLDLLVREGGFEISAREMGGGVQNAIVLAILKAFEETHRKGAILLIEEPEMFLHPQMQRSLYKTIREIGKTNQVIYTTHSPHFVSVPSYEEVMLVRRTEAGTKVFPSSLPTSSQRREKLVKELDPERSELFFARRLLLVEGDTEKLALPVYATRLQLDLDREGVTIVEVGGKRNLLEFAQIAVSFGIPTGIVYDEYSSEFSGYEQGDEQEYQRALDALSNLDGGVRTWALDPDYEGELRAAIGDKEYQRLCQKFPNTGKPTRARLIALEENTTIPSKVESILKWAAAQ